MAGEINDVGGPQRAGARLHRARVLPKQPFALEKQPG